MALRVVEHAGLTDVGRQREANEDTFVVDSPLFAVADGMGGARAGETASKMAKEVLEAGDDAGTPEERLIRMIRQANRLIYERASHEESRRGMGTTTTAAILEGKTLAVGHVGDSRAYRLRDGSLEQLTRDHSLVAAMVASGMITKDEARVHPERNKVLRSLGGQRSLPDDAIDGLAVVYGQDVLRLRDGDQLLLCSDGIWSVLDDVALLRILSESPDCETAVSTAIRLVLEGGAPDNAAIIVARCQVMPAS